MNSKELYDVYLYPCHKPIAKQITVNLGLLIDDPTYTYVYKFPMLSHMCAVNLINNNHYHHNYLYRFFNMIKHRREIKPIILEI